MGEDLLLLPGACLRAAAARYEAELARLPEALRGRFEEEQAAFLQEAHGWLRRHNRSLSGRVRGYLALGRSMAFEYPWPVVALLGLCQVAAAIRQSRAYGLLGAAAARLPLAGLSALERSVDQHEDLGRRRRSGSPPGCRSRRHRRS